MDAMTLDIFVVDDETAIGELLLELLQLEGYRVAWVASATEGLRQIAEQHPRVVLSDVMMPDMNGVELMARIDSGDARAKPRCVLMSAAPPPRDVPRGVPFLRKPFDLDSMLGVIRGELEKAQRAGSLAQRTWFAAAAD